MGATRTYHRMACAIEDAGFDIRDSIAWINSQGFAKDKNALKPCLTPMVLARKPLSERTLAANLRVHGTGGLNIDAARIRRQSGDRTEYGREKELPHSSTGESGIYGHYASVTPYLPHSDGRWPANFMLAHHEECVQTGTKRVKAPTINRFTDGMKPFGEGAGHPYETIQTGDAEGMEEIETWQCHPDCPVRALNEQSRDGKASRCLFL
jgi:site-specific DNA-methyltransferase (adenine-specific)